MKNYISTDTDAEKWLIDYGTTGFSLAFADSASLTDDQIVNFVLTIDPSAITLATGSYWLAYDGQLPAIGSEFNPDEPFVGKFSYYTITENECQQLLHVPEISTADRTFTFSLGAAAETKRLEGFKIFGERRELELQATCTGATYDL